MRDSAAGDKTLDGEQSPHRDGFFSVPVVVIGRRRTRKSETLTLQKFVHKKSSFVNFFFSHRRNGFWFKFSIDQRYICTHEILFRNGYNFALTKQ